MTHHSDIPLNYLIGGVRMRRVLLTVTLLLFTVLTAVALARHGYWGIIAPHFRTFGAGQVFADLVISLSLILVWLWRDARATGRTPWPWVAITLALGAFGPLLYLLLRPNRSASVARAAP
jgi:hypothetical protein